MNHLESLKNYTTVVADTGDVEAIKQFSPQDATTNPSLILKAAQMPEYADLVKSALSWASAQPLTEAERASAFSDKLFVDFGKQILEIVPGRVSTEVDARLSYDEVATVAKAQRLIRLYEAAGVERERVLIKVAATWAGIRAAETLEAQGIHTNLTLLFSFAQAVACAQAGVTLISPFVGRIFDWYKKDAGVDDLPIESDPGVASVTRIYNYYKKFGYTTQVMGASFRKAGQIVGLAGCDLLTISPGLLETLRDTEGEISAALTVESAQDADESKLDLDLAGFDWLHGSDPMAVEKLADGIRRFYADGQKLVTWAMQAVGQ